MQRSTFTNTSNITTVKDFANEINVPVPSDFICPLTGDVINTPLMTINGINFDRDAIIERFEHGKFVCPITKQPLGPSGVIRNRALEDKIAFWKFENCIPDLPSSKANNASSPKTEVIGIVSPTKKSTIKKFQRIIAVQQLGASLEKQS